MSIEEKQGLKDSDFSVVANAFGNLGDSTRLKVFFFLCHHEGCVSDIAQVMKMSSPAVSHHLKVLKDEGLIESRRNGKEVLYRASTGDLGQLMHNMIEKVMDLTCPESTNEEVSSSDGGDDYIRKVHDYLFENLDRRITIDELSQMFHVNPTTLKYRFKETYKGSIASHIKEHRMEKAAILLRETGLSIGEIASRVGYDSQSKFSSAFRSHYGDNPVKYRRDNSQKNN